MAIFIKLIANFASWLYIFLGLGILFFLRVVIIARREQELAVFSLEREAAINKRYRAALAALVLALLAGGVYYVSNVLAEQVPMPGEVEPTATPLLFLTPTPTPAPPTATPTATNTPRPPSTPPPPPTDTPAALPTPTTLPPVCPNPSARITYPPMHAIVNGVMQIVGSADVDNLDYYKFEYRSLGAADWFFLQSFHTPVSGGVLGAWDTGTVEPGEYEFRLVVVDATGNYPEPCVVTITIVR
jgi:hypothetical protein